MDAKQFCIALKNVLEKYNDELVENWDRSKEYTEKINEKIPEVAEGLGLRCYPEYLKLDFVFYERFDPKLEPANYVEKIDVIIEHENDRSTAQNEVKTLCYWKADLKVVITYTNKNASKYKKQDLLNLWEGIIKDSGGKNDNFLVALGSLDDKNIQWEFYEQKSKLEKLADI